jgi:hypothetical protein
MQRVSVVMRNLAIDSAAHRPKHRSRPVDGASVLWSFSHSHGANMDANAQRASRRPPPSTMTRFAPKRRRLMEHA